MPTLKELEAERGARLDECAETCEEYIKNHSKHLMPMMMVNLGYLMGLTGAIYGLNDQIDNALLERNP